jgi:Protein of unknown function (DUF2793)
MSSTPRLGLPFLSAGQAQKEVFHNEALQTLDVLVGGAVEEPPRASPPAAPSAGACYIVGAGATGAWAGQADCLAAFTTAGWRFTAPQEGATVYVRSTGTFALFRAGAWEFGQLRGSAVLVGGQQVVGNRAPAISSPSGGTVVDSEARGIIEQILAAIRQHGLIES